MWRAWAVQDFVVHADRLFGTRKQRSHTGMQICAHGVYLWDGIGSLIGGQSAGVLLMNPHPISGGGENPAALGNGRGSPCKCAKRGGQTTCVPKLFRYAFLPKPPISISIQ